MPRFLSSLFFFVLILSSSALGFDGQRKGFVLGGGLGGTYASYQNKDVTIGWYGSGGHLKESGPGFAANMVIGGGLDDRNVLALEINGVGYGDQDSGHSMGQGFIGPVWYLYFRPSGRSFFTTVGFGTSFYRYENRPRIKTDVGVLLGVGLSSGGPLQVGFYYASTTGMTSSGNLSHRELNVILTYVAF